MIDEGGCRKLYGCDGREYGMRDQQANKFGPERKYLLNLIVILLDANGIQIFIHIPDDNDICHFYFYVRTSDIVSVMLI